MKHALTSFLLVALIALGTAGCASTGTVTPRRADDTLHLVDQYMAAWNAHDSGTAAGFLDDKVEYFDATTAEPQIGRRNAQKNIIQAFITAVPDLVWRREASSPIIGHDSIAFQWTLSGTNTGNWPDGAKATGKKFSIHGATLMRLQDGKITYQGDYYDAYGFYKQLGLAQ